MNENHDDRPRAIFIHGAGGGGWEWAIWQRIFTAHGWRTIAPDLVPAAAGLVATQFADYADQVTTWARVATPTNADSVDGVTRTLSTDRISMQPVLIGASLGGLIALAAAEKIAPRALILINPLPPAGIAARGVAKEYPDIVSWRSARRFDSTTGALPDANDAAQLFAFRHWRDESGTVLRTASSGIQVEKPRCPTLLMASEFDSDVSPESSRELATFYAAEFRPLRGASHIGPLLGHNAAATAEAALRWLVE